MRKRFRVPKKIYRRGLWYCFKITDSSGKRREIKSLSEKEARFKLMEMTRQVFSSVSDKPTYRVTFEQGIDFWLSTKKGSIDDTSYIRYKAYTKNFLEFLGSKRPNLKYYDEIQPEHIKEFMDYRIYEKKRATKTVNSERMALYNLFSILIEHNKISNINPVSKIRSLKVIKVQKRHCLSDEELAKFLKGAKAESGDINWYAIYLTLYICGFRRDEVRKMEKSFVDLSKGIITIEDTKTDRPKIIPIHPELKPVLQKAIAQAKGKYVFPDSKGNILNKNKMRNKMIEICEKVGITKATIHDLRHTFASRPGLSSKTKQEIGGWSSKQVMEKTYNNPPEDIIRKEYCNTSFLPKPKD